MLTKRQLTFRAQLVASTQWLGFGGAAHAVFIGFVLSIMALAVLPLAAQTSADRQGGVVELQGSAQAGASQQGTPVQASARAANALQARAAMESALSMLQKPYVLGGDGPDVFDCSGLIMWAYWEALGKEQLFVVEGVERSDLTMDELYRYAIQLVPQDKVRPGDVIFIGPSEAEIVHGGLVVSLDERGVRFVNASSYFGSVTLDFWTFKKPVRGQYILGYGRLLYR